MIIYLFILSFEGK